MRIPRDRLKPSHYYILDWQLVIHQGYYPPKTKWYKKFWNWLIGKDVINQCL